MKERILLLGSTGYVGSAFAAELQRRSSPFYSLSRKDLEYTRFDLLWHHLKTERPKFVVCAAGYTGKPNVDACETARAETLLGNTFFPQSLAQACLATGIPFGHVSSGCIYSGAKVVENGQTRIESDLTRPDLRQLVESSLRSSRSFAAPDSLPSFPSVKEPGLDSASVNSVSSVVKSLAGFSESDTPNFSFRSPPCSFYSGTKALGEEVMAPLGNGYLWRLRIPFDEFDNPRNYLTKVQTYSKVYDNANSISHRADFVGACLDLWENRAPFGIYNITNPGWVTTRHVIERIQKILKPARTFEFWQGDSEFYKFAKAPRSNCIMDVTKLLSAGVKIRPVDEALDHSLRNWE